jgi:uncharacterized protein YbjQ (UPF0145 family)
MIDLIIFLSLMALGYLAGSWAEKRHYHSIKEREKELLRLPAITLKNIPYPDERIRALKMVSGNAVISIDYFKRILARLRNIFGGTVKSYESLLDRARREAILRMKEKVPQASIIINVRVETSTIGKNQRKRSVSCIEALAYGTAIILHEE